MCHRTEVGRYKVDINEVDTTSSGKEMVDAEELAHRYTKVLECYIYKYPEEWFWPHNRWKRIEKKQE